MQRIANASLADRTTLGLGGPARELVVADSIDELRELVVGCESLLVLGGGSNLVVGDRGFDGTVVQLGWRDVQLANDIVTVAAGADWDGFVAQMVDDGRAGIECLSGIPGRVGATPMQNVGAYGQEVADTIVHVDALDRFTGEHATFAREQCGFAYRTSWFKQSSRWIVTAVAFRLPKAAPAPIRYAELLRAIGGGMGLRDIRAAVIALRRAKAMVVDPSDPDSKSAGSFFTNPIVDHHDAARVAGQAGAAPPQWPQPDGRVKLSAAWLIERAGFTKGTTRGRVGISTKHALALVNRGGATTAELLAFADEIRAGVSSAFGIVLESEPVVVGQ
ncbi:MAG TPA: UDP-N-acetylmuramate dehydrogenase [Kofleriaceae bacterium]|jgi:UDP-N-acetylmuramate dehydrogenase|nr:UDP-N-acetylmuramate dehydrogenase [Kofleriaceae bacterium]